jgi:hypothetical protein
VTRFRRDVVIITCAISAGIHGALTPAHFDERTGAGIGFLASTILLALLAVGLTLWPASPIPLAGAAITFVGLLAAYGLAITTGVPALHPEAEPVDGLALATKSFEVAGLVTALNLLWRRPAVHSLTRRSSETNTTQALHPIPLGLTVLVALSAALTALAVSNGHDGDAHTNAAEHAVVSSSS